MSAVASIFCRECGARGECPDLLPYLVSGRNGKFFHVWLHQLCSGGWHMKWRAWRFEGAEVSA